MRITAALIWFLATVARAQQPVPMLNIPSVEHPPLLDDFLEGHPPAQSAVIRDFRQREPQDGAPVSLQTEAYLSYDAKNFYVVFVCHDDPSAIRAHMTKREDISGEDLVSVALDTFHDRQRAYVFESNPLGIQRDSILTEGSRGQDYSFDTVWASEGRLTPFGFVVWMSIPFKSLRFSGEQMQDWGIALTRSIPRKNEDAYWPYVTSRVQGFAQQMATLTGVERISPGHNFQLIPYVTGSNSRFLASGPGLTTSNDIRGGVDGKIVLKDSLTLDFTVNPDFSQVESDDTQVTVNQRYEVRYPEKRPFFLENRGYFDTPVFLFFSRRIVDPGAGARLSGKVGRWAIGLLATDDRAPGKSVDASDPRHNDLAGIGVARIAREFGEQSSIGVFMTDREFGSSFNRVAAADIRLKLSANWSMSAQAIRTFDRQLDGSHSEGTGYYGQIGFNNRHLNYGGSSTVFSPDFRAPMGFIQRVDIREADQYGSYYWRPEHSIVTSVGPSISVSAISDHTGRVTDWSGGGQFSVNFRGPMSLAGSSYKTYEYYLGQGFRKTYAGGSFYTGWLRWLEMYASYSAGDTVNYSPAYGLQPFLGRGVNASFSATLHFPRLRMEQYYYWTRLAERPSGGGLTVFNNHIMRSKINYQFTRALSARTIIDYYSQLPNEALVNQIHFKQVTTDVLLTYLLHPGTAFYLGYTNRFQNLGQDPANPQSLIFTGPPTYQTQRLLFVKLSYFFRF